MENFMFERFSELIGRLEKCDWAETCPGENEKFFIKDEWVCSIHLFNGVRFYLVR